MLDSPIKYAPISFSTFYDSTETSNLPFNDGNDATSNSETSCFLAPLSKANSYTTLNQKSNKLSLLVKALHLNDSTNKPIDQYLDFKKLLLPSMLSSIQSITNKLQAPVCIIQHDHETDESTVVKEEDSSTFQSKSNLFKSAMSLLPTDSQWYLLNQLRIHSGSPERSDLGIEKLLQ